MRSRENHKKGLKGNYGRLIDFLSQISKLSYFNLLDLVDFSMHHLCLVLTFLMQQPWVCANPTANLYLQYVYRFELRHHASPNLFCPLVVKKNEFFLRTLRAYSILVCFDKFQAVNPGCAQSHAAALYSTAVRGDIRAAFLQLWKVLLDDYHLNPLNGVTKNCYLPLKMLSQVFS